MKKRTRILSSCLGAAFLLGTAFSLVGCAQEKEIINAYDIAVKNGFVGTEAEWLLSLHGKNGEDGESLNIYDLYEAAKNSQSGYDGDILQFIQDYLNGDVYFLPDNNDTASIANNVASSVSVYCAFRQKSNWYEQNRAPKVGGSAGSGVIIDYGFNKEAGTAYLLTNYHVVYDMASATQNGISDCIYVYPIGARNNFTHGDINGDDMLDDVNGDKKFDVNDQGDQKGEGIRATYIGGAMDYDIAILKIEGSEYFKNSACQPAVWGDSNEIKVGEKVFAVGNSNGQGISVTQGLVSVASEYIKMSALDGRDTNGDQKVDPVSFRVLRTDAAINHGNSGGGLFTAQGKLVGIVNAKNVEDETDNMGYALPITQLRNIVYNILDNVKAGVGNFGTRAMLGVTTSIEKTQSVLENGELKIKETITLSEFSGPSLAAKDKLLIGDIFKSITLKDPLDRTKMKTVEVTRQFEINDLLWSVRKGDTVTFTILRDGAEKNVDITFNQNSYFVKYA